MLCSRYVKKFDEVFDLKGSTFHRYALVLRGSGGRACDVAVCMWGRGYFGASLALLAPCAVQTGGRAADGVWMCAEVTIAQLLSFVCVCGFLGGGAGAALDS